MKGNNEIMLNEATLKEAVQEYLDSRFAANYRNRPIVRSIDSVGASSKQFCVRLVEPGDDDGDSDNDST